MAAIAGGAEEVVLPELEIDPEDIATTLTDAYERGKQHAIVVVAEGAKYNANALDEYFKQHRERLGFDLRVTILGMCKHGAPQAYDHPGIHLVSARTRRHAGMVRWSGWSAQSQPLQRRL
jgi:6-phosphofructokinase 1